jgi:hypothetical protein
MALSNLNKCKRNKHNLERIYMEYCEIWKMYFGSLCPVLIMTNL